jgi:hypothetical protein
MTKLEALDYAHPAVFFAGEYRARNAVTAWMAAIGLGIAAGFWFVATQSADFSARDRLVFYVFGAFPACIGVGCMWMWLLDGVHAVHVTSDGLIVRGGFWPWAAVANVGASEGNGGVLLTFRPAGGVPRVIHTTPALTAEQYVHLRHQLDAFFALQGLKTRTSDIVEATS